MHRLSGGPDSPWALVEFLKKYIGSCGPECSGEGITGLPVSPIAARVYRMCAGTAHERLLPFTGPLQEVLGHLGVAGVATGRWC